MKILKISIILLILGFLLSEFCIAQNAEEHYARGTGYLEIRLIDKAIVEFKKALPLFEEDQSQMKAETYVSLANAYNWRGIYKAAITACKKAIEINPDLAHAHYNLGFAYREEEEDKLAAKEFAIYDKLLRQEGEFIEIPEKSTSEDIIKHVALGDNYFKEGKFDDAISEYKKALEIKPDDDILNKLGQVYQRKRLINGSKDKPAKIEQLTTLENGKEAQNPLNLPLEKGETGGFVGFPDETITGIPGLKESDETLQETSADDHSTKGATYYDKGMLDEAIVEFKEVVEIDSQNAEAHYNLGNAYVDKEMYDEAISTYKKTIELNPEFIDAYLNLGTIYLDRGLADDAISLYKQAVELNPDDPDLCYHLGGAYQHKKRYKKAIVEFKKAISINPMDPDTQYHLAEVYYETRQYELALEHIRSAEELGYPVDQEVIDILKKKAGSR